MVDGGLDIQKSAWVDYTQHIHEEADVVQGSIISCLQVRFALNCSRDRHLICASRRQNGVACPGGQKERTPY